MPYATAEDYAESIGKPREFYDDDPTEKARINAGLLDAQGDIAALIYLSYWDNTDPDRVAEVNTALTRATCQQFKRAETTGDDGTGAQSMYQSVKIGSVSLARSDQNGQQIDPNATQYSPRAMSTLRAAGLLTGIVFQS